VLVKERMMSELSQKIVLLGDPKLREISEEVLDVKDEMFVQETEALTKALDEFRKKNGFGRAISAPQIGVNKRLIACNLGEGTFLIINPVITLRSQETFTLWDDCMSFPWLMTKVSRNKSISIQYLDKEGNSQQMMNLDMTTSELLQHEIDHLDGILSLDIVANTKDIISREVYENNKEAFDNQVDYFIIPTI